MTRDYAHLFRLDGRHAVVVGAGSGIGREAALALAAQGAHVTCADQNLPAAQQTAELGSSSTTTQPAESSTGSAPTPKAAESSTGSAPTPKAAESSTGSALTPQPTDRHTAGKPTSGKLTAYELNVLDPDAVSAAAQELGDVDVLVFTAATNVRKRILDYSGDEFDRVVALNLRASFDLIRAFGRPMTERGRGSIIGFSSIRATTVEPGQSVYAATKAGLVQLLRTAAAEFGPSGVRVNAIAPGVVETPLTEQIKADPDWYAAYAAKSALARWATPDELAGAVVYLASDASTFVTGSVLPVDGGWTAIDGRFDPPN
ncbi:short-chain dehydrogenase/reductase SDR [Kribbella flavida DSM 17836]|uniref:Short-chain dehydrogenase/reductase SDR n=1 Tax=Kribbella flavida (strain DSM 17836 / JCM 10339 / NBRC 14399) TaxID=479435 RepID=D2PY65_KRIFD|nr:short-chain dehydrogenase/reductase SDR [Kribbella flavida DSM 17836]